jgi:hypothetical protein
MRLFVAAAAIAIAVRAAHGEPPAEVMFRVEPAVGEAAPSIVATVIGGAVVPLEKYTLVTKATSGTVTLRPSKRRDPDAKKDTIAIALVFNGAELWIGNDHIEKDQNAIIPGRLDGLEKAIDASKLAAAGPPGSKFLAVAYSFKAKVTVAPIELAKLKGKVLGTQRDYYQKIGFDLAEGVTLALAELDKLSTTRKAMIVIGDGTDTDSDRARKRLVDLRKQAAAQQVEVFAIRLRSVLGSMDQPVLVVEDLTPTVSAANSEDGVVASLKEIVARTGDRFYLTFPGWDSLKSTGLPWDTREHDLVLELDGKALAPVTVKLAPAWLPKSPK